MTGQEMTRHGLIAAVVAVLAIAAAAGETAGNGELRIEGQGIEQLVLRDPKGAKRTIEPVGATLTLPADRYFVHEVRLQGGHYSRAYLMPQNLCVTVSPDAPATLKLGAPLRQVVKVERQGPVLALNYELIGQGGESYVINRNQVAQRPAFTVYRGDAKVASGDFAFG